MMLESAYNKMPRFIEFEYAMAEYGEAIASQYGLSSTIIEKACRKVCSAHPEQFCTKILGNVLYRDRSEFESLLFELVKNEQ